MPERKRTIVIVEDEQDTAEMFAEMTRLCGFRALIATTSPQAMGMIKKEKPAAVLLDIMIPEISGFEVLRFMQKETKLTGIPVILVSAKGLPSDVQAGMQRGAAAYLVKPVGYDDLKDALEKVLKV
jgi:DNA-binding response OmpR family regulator